MIESDAMVLYIIFIFINILIALSCSTCWQVSVTIICISGFCKCCLCISRASNTITPIFEDETLIPTRANSRQSRLEITIEQTPDFSRLYNKQTVSPLHITSFTCCICLDDDLENTKTLLCGHMFHQKCIEEWLQKEESCPLCREEFEL